MGHNRNICLYRVNTYMDFLFIFLYWLVFLTFAQIEKGPFAKLASAAITIAAVADIWENLRIFGALNAVAATQPPDFLLPRNVSLVKWAFLGIVFILLAVAVWLSKGRWYVLVAAALFVSGLAVLAGLRYPAAMQAAGLGFLLVFILLLCRVWPHRRNALSERG